MFTELAKAAIAAREMAYAPYSRFWVGAALLEKSGKIYTGCNIESAAFSPTNCAERTALFKAISEGEKDFVALAVVGYPEGGEPDYCYPCGVCRQTFCEFVSDDFQVVVVKTPTDCRLHSFNEILPYSFGSELRDKITTS